MAVKGLDAILFSITNDVCFYLSDLKDRKIPAPTALRNARSDLDHFLNQYEKNDAFKPEDGSYLRAKKYREIVELLGSIDSAVFSEETRFCTSLHKFVSQYQKHYADVIEGVGEHMKSPTSDLNVEMRDFTRTGMSEQKSFLKALGESYIQLMEIGYKAKVSASP